jgi:hypothetical protein
MHKNVLIILLLAMVSLPSFGQYYEGPYDPIKIHYKTPGFISINEVSYGDGQGLTEGLYSDYFISVTTIFGYYVSQNFMFGVGTGVYIYDGGSLLPIFLDIRFTLNFKKLNPYFFWDGGFLTILDDPSSTTKLYMNPGVGIRYVLSYSVAATAAIGGFIQEGGAKEDRDTFINYKLGVIIKPRRK